MKKITLLLISLLLFVSSASAESKLKLATLNWEPYFGENLKNNGVLSAIAQAAFQKAGYSAEIQFTDWKRAVGMTKSGRVDGLFGCYYTDERAKTMNMSEPIGQAEIIFLSKKGANIPFTSLEDLKPYKIGIVQGQVYTREFDSAGFLEKEAVANLEINFKKLLNDRIDLMIGSKLALLHNLKKNFPQDFDKIEVLDKALQTNSLHIGFSRKMADHEKVTTDFNNGLKMIKDDGTYDKIMKEYGF